MIVFPTLRYRDANAAVEWLQRGFGLEPKAVYRGDDGTVHHAELGLGDGLVMVGQQRDDGSTHGIYGSSSPTPTPTAPARGRPAHRSPARPRGWTTARGSTARATRRATSGPFCKRTIPTRPERVPRLWRSWRVERIDRGKGDADMLRRASWVLAGMTLWLLWPAGAQAATKPAATTGAAANVAQTTATLTGDGQPARRGDDLLLPDRHDQRLRRQHRRHGRRRRHRRQARDRGGRRPRAVHDLPLPARREQREGPHQGPRPHVQDAAPAARRLARRVARTRSGSAAR